MKINPRFLLLTALCAVVVNAAQAQGKPQPLIVAVGDSRSAEHMHAILTSEKADVWKLNEFPGSQTDHMLSNVSWGNDKYLVISNSLASSPFDPSPSWVRTSTDGLNWSAPTSLTNTWMSCAVWGNNQYVAVGNSGRIVTSLNGTTWSAQGSSIPSNVDLTKVIWVEKDKQYVAVGRFGYIFISNDGKTWAWTSRDLHTTAHFYGLAWGNNKYVTLGDSDSTAYTSTNGRQWTAHKIPGDVKLTRVAWGNNLFVAVGDNIYSSPDGETWTLRDDETKTYRSVIWTGSQFVAVGNEGIWGDGDSFVATSPDGIKWTAKTTKTWAKLWSVT